MSPMARLARYMVLLARADRSGPEVLLQVGALLANSRAVSIPVYVRRSHAPWPELGNPRGVEKTTHS
jgi:hypothetical protein